MNSLEENIKAKKEILKGQISDIKSFSIDLNDGLQEDKQKLKKIAIAYEHSGGLLERTNKQLDKLLNQSEVRIGIYVVGISVMIFALIWKLSR
ncbi:hypothetical protein SteCoe_4621 [Stentor coeruleus]|uniref:t-SNARE coiled-coil homology domain-containing protein n=1 Tax=Stentor coeruleus TaxID=5963 RepID=A0A1R2CUF6_9CILI|nr:hypothetical protein SteCoe_4621 [Stentor coeruleus]